MTDTNKLNQLCAEKMGLLARGPGEVLEYQRPDVKGTVFQRVKFPDGRVGPCYIENLPDYCSDHNAAITLLDALAKDWQVDVQRKRDESKWCVVLYDEDKDFVVENESLPLAIVEVFLRAHGIWEEEP